MGMKVAVYTIAKDEAAHVERWAQLFIASMEDETAPYAPVIGLFDRQIKDDKPMTIVGNGEQRRSFTHIDDVIEANISAMNADIDAEFLGTVFNIGYEKNYSINEIAGLFDGKKISIPPRPGESKETFPDISKAKGILGWHPKHSLEEYIKSSNISVEW